MSADAAAPANRSEIRSLTGLRGIAALYVVLFHASGLTAFPDLMRPVLSHGYMAVDLFFILSGFVMAMVYGDMFRDGFNMRVFGRFLLLRLARIYPLYLLVTAVTAVAITTVLSHTYRFDDNVLRALPYNLTMTHVWGLAYAIVPPSWSISTEWAAYLLFPAGLWLALRTPRHYAFLGVAAAFVSLTWIAYGPYWLNHLHRAAGKLDVVHSYAPGTTLRCLASFYLGLVAFRFRHVIPARATGVLAVLALFLLGFKATDVWLVAVFAVLIMALSHQQGAVSKMLGAPVLHWLGVVSFALYLVHDLIQKVIFKSFPAWGIGTDIPKLAWATISVLVALGVAALAHYYFEKPSRGWARQLIKAMDARKPVVRPVLVRVTGYLRSVAARPLPPAE